MSNAKDPRTLISDGRRHDEAMPEAPWIGEMECLYSDSDDNGTDLIAELDPNSDGDAVQTAAAVAWMRTNLRALLDGYAAALDEVEAVTRAHASVCRELTEREQQREDSARWLEEERQKVDELLARQQDHLALIAKLTRETPYPAELDECRTARSALIAEVGTLRAELRASKETK